MAQSRDVGGLGQVSLTPAQFVPEKQFSGPADQSATQSLIAGLGNLSEGVARLGMIFASDHKKQTDDPEARRLAAARAQMEVLQAGNNPDAAAKLYASTPADDTLNRNARGAAAANAYFDSLKSEYLKLASEQGVQNVDWNKQFAADIARGKKAGYLPDDNAGAAFLTSATQMVDTFRTNGNITAGNDAAFQRVEKIRVATSNDFVKTLQEGGAPAAQGVLNKLFSSPEYTSLGPEQRQKLLESTISGIVQSGNVRAFNALAQIDGPDGVNLKVKYAQEWEVWDKQARDNAKAVHDGDLIQGVLDNQPTYEDSIKQLKDGPAGEYATTLVRKRNAALNLAQESLAAAAAAHEKGDPVDIDKIRQDAIDRATADGVFDGDGKAEAQAAFIDVFDKGAAQYKSIQQDAANKDARLKSDTETSNALKVTFDTALKNGGPDAALAAVETYMTDNKVFMGRSLTEQGAMLSGVAQTYAKEGNTKALETLGKVKVNKLGDTVENMMKVDWPVLQAQAAEAAHSKWKAQVEPIKEKARVAAATGNMSDELHAELIDAGVPPSFVVDMWDKNDAVIKKKTDEITKLHETKAKSEFLDKNASLAANAIRNGRGDLLVGTETQLDPSDPTKVLKISREDQLKAGMKEAEQQFAAEYDALHPGADPQERKMAIRHEVMRYHSRSGIVDDNTKETFKSFMQKAQRDGYSIGQDDLAQLKDMRDAMDIYSRTAIDDMVGTDGPKRDFFDAMMAKLNETEDPATAITYARHIRDAPDDQRVAPPEKRVTDLLKSAVDQLGVEDDPYIEGVLKKTLTRQMQLGASDDYAQSVALKEISSRYAAINGRHVNMKQLAANVTPDLASEVLADAAEQYVKKYGETLHGIDIAFDNGPRSGTLQIYDKTTGLPISSKLLNWSEIFSDYDKRVLQPRKAQDEAARIAREKELSARAKAYGEQSLQREQMRRASGQSNADKLLMPPRLRD